MKPVYPLSRKENLVVQEVDHEVLVYDLNENKAFCLNKTSALVWNACDGKTPVSQINQLLAEKLRFSSSEDLVWLAIDELKKNRLIVNGEEIASNFQGLSRREVIKKVGLGTMPALPIVASLVAPTAIQAGSTCSTVNGACQCPTTTGIGGSCVSASRGANCSCITTGCGQFNCIGTCQNT